MRNRGERDIDRERPFRDRDEDAIGATDAVGTKVVMGTKSGRAGSWLIRRLLAGFVNIGSSRKSAPWNSAETNPFPFGAKTE